MVSETFSVRSTPKTTVTKALTIMKRIKIPEYKLMECSVAQQGDTHVACARWEEYALLFCDSIVLRVNAKKSYSGKGTDVEVCNDGVQCARLTQKLRREL